MITDSARPRLRELRRELGWTQQELAERLAHLAWMQRREHAGVNADRVAKREHGVKGINPRYRALLCRLFGVTPDQLDLKNTPPSATGGTQPVADDQSLLAMLDNAAGPLDQLGAAGTALAPHLLHAWKDAVTTRRTMLGLLDPSATDPVGHARAATATVADLEQLTQRYHALYEATGDAWTPEGGTSPSSVRSSTASCTEEPLMAGRHRLRGRRVQRTARNRAVEVVDARTLTAHFLTMDALAAGRLPTGRYIAICGQDVLPACLIEPGRSRCPSCVSIPSRNRGCCER